MTADQHPAAGREAAAARLGSFLDDLDARTRRPGEPPLRQQVAEQARARLSELGTAAPPAATVPDDSVTEGRCSGAMCWYTLPVVNGLVVAHSKSGTLDDCEGAGRPPLTPRLPDAERLAEAREAVARELHARGGTARWDGPYGQEHRDLWLRYADELLSLPAVLAWAGRDQQDGAR